MEDVQLTFKQKTIRFIKKNAVFFIALLAAAITCFFVPFNKGYLEYFDWRTLACLFCTLLVVSALKTEKVFVWAAVKIVTKFGNLRRIVLALVFITYIGSMIMANDMALITFLPLGYYALSACHEKKVLAFTFIMQNVAANLGGMLTPFGNPQNLYLYSYFHIPTGEFFGIMALPFAVAFVLILVTCLFVKPEKVELDMPITRQPIMWKVAVYLILFAVSLLIVFRLFAYYIGLAIVTIGVLCMVPKAFKKVDYGLLGTFAAFFVFSGNLAQIDAVAETLGRLVSAAPLLVGTASCQVISNVPSAVLLSRFTIDYQSLLMAVNIGGLGTPIASLASLITLGEYRRRDAKGTGRYLLKFLLINFSYLFILILTCLLVGVIF